MQIILQAQSPRGPVIMIQQWPRTRLAQVLKIKLSRVSRLTVIHGQYTNNHFAIYTLNLLQRTK